MPTLDHSPAEVIARLLVERGLGTDPDVYGTWPIYDSSEPDLPDQLVTVLDIAGSDDGVDMTSGDHWEHYGVRVFIRARTFSVGYPKAQAIAAQLDGEDGDDAVVDVGSKRYHVKSVHRITEVIPLGKETTVSRRDRFQMDARITIRVLV